VRERALGGEGREGDARREDVAGTGDRRAPGGGEKSGGSGRGFRAQGSSPIRARCDSPKVFDARAPPRRRDSVALEERLHQD
jgi:hypothetical protein